MDSVNSVGSMKWATAVSRSTDLDEAVAGCAEELREELGQEPVSLVLVFVTPHYAERYREVPSLVLSYFGTDALLGCSAGGVIGGGEEVEGAPAVTLTAARMQDVEVRGFRIGGRGRCRIWTARPRRGRSSSGPAPPRSHSSCCSPTRSPPTP